MIKETITIYVIVTLLEIIIPCIIYSKIQKRNNFDGGKYTYEDEVLELPEDMRK